MPSIHRIRPHQYVVSCLMKGDKMPLIECSGMTIYFPDHLKENYYDEKEVMKELKKLQVNSTESATSLRRLLKEKSRIEEEIKAKMSEHCSTILKDALPLKEKRPRENDKIVFRSDSPTSNIIKKVYMLGLRERMELDLEARLMGEALILNRSQDIEYGDFIELYDLNEELEIRNHTLEDLEPTIEE
ncbi:hypothetical protein Tco_0465463 [Tanacetum coccineum]